MVTVFVNLSSVHQQIALSIIVAKYGSDVNIQDLSTLDEADITAEIAAMDDDSQEAIFVLATPVTPYVEAGDITEAQVTALAAKCLSDAVAPFDAAIVEGDTTATKRAPVVIWELLYPDIARPRIVQYFGGTNYWPVLSISAAAIADTTVTKVGAFAGLNLVGKYVALAGGLEVAMIKSHTNNALTVEPGTGVTSGSMNAHVIDFPEEAFATTKIDYASKSLQITGIGNKEIMQWIRLIDAGILDPQQNRQSDSRMSYTIQDVQFLKEMFDLGGKIQQYVKATS